MIVGYLYDAAHVKTRPPSQILRSIRLVGWYPFLVLAVAFLQFPLHAYSVLTLRKSNEGLLASGSTEQKWGFGQVSALILLAPNAVGVIVGVIGKQILLRTPLGQNILTVDCCLRLS